MRVAFWILVLLALSAVGPSADAGFGIYAVSNSTVPSGGALLDDSAGLLLAPYPGKILAR